MRRTLSTHVYWYASNNMEEIENVLLRINSSEEQLEKAASDLVTLLQVCSPANGEALRCETFTRGLVRSLLGILRCSSNTRLLTKAATCIAAIAFDSDESRTRLARTDVIKVLLCLISPQPDRYDRNKLVWRRDWMSVYEQVLNVLRKLTYHSFDNQQQLLQQGGIKLIIELSADTNFHKESCSFSPEAKRQLTDLTLGTKLYCQSTQAPSDVHSVIHSAFPALASSNSSLSQHYPSFLVSLATPNQQWIAPTMIASGCVWSDPAPLPSSCRMVTTCVYATHVEDGGHVWCQFCSENISEKVQKLCSSLRSLPPPPTSAPPTITIGDVYAAFIDPSRYPAQACGCVTVPQWCRVRLLEILEAMEGEKHFIVFAVDFGFTVVIPPSCLALIPPQCRGIPPQAVPCRLVGVTPIPSSLAVLENGAAILRNMAFEMEGFRREIYVFKGIETLLKLSQYPHDEVCEQALGALINMAVSKEMRRTMGQLGVVQTMMTLCKKYSKEANKTLLQMALGCLQNLLHLCPSNADIVFSQEGHRDLAALLLGGACEGVELREKVRGVLRALAGPNLEQFEKIELAFAEVAGETTRMSMSSPPKPTASRSHSLETQSHLRRESRTRYREKCRNNGERVHPSPRYRCLEDEDGDGEVGGGASGTDSDTTDGEMLVDSEEEGEMNTGETSGAVSQRSYIADSYLPVTQDMTHHFMSAFSIYSLSKKKLKRTICAMVNTCCLSTIYIGVMQDGRVAGLKANRKQRDLLLIELDNMMKEFVPTIKHDRYQVNFVPVGYTSPSQSTEVVEDYFVVELQLLGIPYRAVHIIKEKVLAGEKAGEVFERCYYRIGPTNEILSHQELRDVIARESCQEYVDTIVNLENNITKLGLRQSEQHH